MGAPSRAGRQVPHAPADGPATIISPAGAAEPALAETLAVTVLDQPLVNLGPEVCADLPSGLGREWLVTNGLGGYASGSLAGPVGEVVG